jgi:lipid-A-disaccharide synthase
MRQGGEGITIGMVAGEASGDALGAELVRAVRARIPTARFAGIAGPRMEAAGCEAWYPMSRLALRGYAEVVSELPALLLIRRDVRRRLLAAKAALFIGVDAPDFNLGLEAALKRAGVRTIHYVSPSVWAWRRERIGTIARSADRLLALFPFEPALYAEAGLPVTFVGHPLAAEAATATSRRETREVLKLDGREPAFALLPGSRLSELEMHSELLLAAAAEILEAQPMAKFLVPLVSRETREYFDAVRGRRRSRRVGNRNPRGRAVALPASDLLPGEPADRTHRRAQVAAALRRAAQRARRALRGPGIPADRGDGGKSRPRRAQSLRRHDHPAPPRGTVRRDGAFADRRYGDHRCRCGRH